MDKNNKEVKYSKFVESVVLDLDDKGIFNLKFDHEALEMAENILKRPMVKLVNEDLDTYQLRVMFKCAVAHEQKLNLNQVKEIIKPFTVMYIMDAVTKAFEIAIGKDENADEEEENEKN